MKLSQFQKLLTVSVFLFSLGASSLFLPLNVAAQVSKIVEPDKADAQLQLVVPAVTAGAGAVKAMYDLWCSSKEFATAGKFECDTYRQPYISSLINDLIFDTVTLFAWGRTSGDVFTAEGTPPFTMTELFGKGPSSANYNEILKHGRMPNGYTSMEASTFYAFQTAPPIPTNMALFINDTFSNTMVGTPAFAANPVQIGYESLVLDAWKLSRNLALSLLGLVFAVVGLMIIFRTKIAPQVTVSIYNVLPTLPIAVALIVLSYPLLSLAGSAIGPLLGWANAIGFQIVASTLDTATSGAVVTTANGSTNTFAVMASAAMYVPYKIWVTLGHANGVTFMFILIALLLAITLGLFHFLWTMAKIFMSFLLITVLAPLVMVVAILPGKQGLIMNLLKKVFVEMVSLPLMVIGAYVAFAIIAYVPEPVAAIVNIPIIGLAGAIPLVIKGFMGLGMLFSLPKIRHNLQTGLNVTDLFGGGDSKPAGRK